MGIFVNQEKINPHSVFSPFWRENILAGPGRKYMGLTIYSPSFPPNQIHSKKVFLPIFFPKFFVYLFHLQTNTPRVIWQLYCNHVFDFVWPIYACEINTKGLQKDKYKRTIYCNHVFEFVWTCMSLPWSAGVCVLDANLSFNM